MTIHGFVIILVVKGIVSNTVKYVLLFNVKINKTIYSSACFLLI